MLRIFLVFIIFIACAVPTAGAKTQKGSGADFCLNISWFENFGDEKLLDYINEALANNKDMAIARKNIQKYRQEKNVNISEEFPNINVGADYLLLKVPKLAIPDNDIQTNSFALPFLTFWEVDYLGKNYNKIQKAKLDIENSIWEMKSSGIIVATDTASAYFNISGLNKQIELKSKITKSLEEIYLRRKKMYESGVISFIELNNAQDIYLRELSDLNDLYKKREFFLTQISYLLGKSPYNISEIKVTPFDNIEYKGIYPKSFSGDIILNRPDIIKADNEVKKAGIDIKIAKKDFLPSINVFGIMAFSTIVNNFGWDGVLAALSAGAFQNLFDGGKRIFNLKKRKIEYETMVQNYLKTDLNALKEVNDALYALKKDNETYKINKNRYSIENSNFVRVLKSYNTGASGYLDYMDELTKLNTSDILLTTSKIQDYINLLTLYKTVGGAL